MPNLPPQPPTATSAIELQTWFDPPVRAYWGSGLVNWWCALLDPVLKTIVAIPTGGAIQFMWTNPPAQNSPQLLTPTLDTSGYYYAILPITATMFGKLLCQVTLTNSSAQMIDQITSEMFVYASGQ